MADKITTVKVLKTNLQFADHDTRLISIENPRDDLTDQDLIAYQTMLVNNQPLIGDKGGAQIVGMGETYIETKTDVELDLTDND